jgi:hypothetical protein
MKPSHHKKFDQRLGRRRRRFFRKIVLPPVRAKMRPAAVSIHFEAKPG